MKVVKLDNVKEWVKVSIFAIVFYAMGFLTCQFVVGVKTEAAIEQLRVKQPQLFVPFKDHEFDSHKFVSCLKDRHSVHPNNTIHCLGQSAYKL